MKNQVKFKSNRLFNRVKSMLKVDFRRMFKSKLFYIVIASALVIPILMIVMMTMMDGSVSVNPNTGEETTIHGPENAWQSIGTLPDIATETEGMDVLAMCNINMMFMGVAVFLCLFISDDFRSGYVKNIFAIRAQKGDYMISKTIAGFACGAIMLILYLLGAMLGGAVTGLSFDLGSLNASNIVTCIISKIFLMLVFVAIDVLVSVAAKQKVWLCLCGSLGAGMLIFMMVGLITPLDATITNVLLCLVGGSLFALGLGVIGKNILNKTSLV